MGRTLSDAAVSPLSQTEVQHKSIKLPQPLEDLIAGRRGATRVLLWALQSSHAGFIETGGNQLRAILSTVKQALLPSTLTAAHMDKESFDGCTN